MVVQFAQNLSRLMEEKQLTKYRLAQMIPCSQSSVSGWLKGREPRGIMRTRLLEVLEVTEEELFYNIKSPAPKEGEAERAEFIRLYEAAPAWLQDQVRSLLKAAESGHAVPDGGPTDK